MRNFLFGLLLVFPANAESQVMQRDTTVIVATDYAFSAPATVPAGAHTFLMVNRGKELHMVVVTRLDSKHTASQAMEMITKNQPTPWAFDVGGPNLAAPGDTSNATIVLEPGHYMLSCWFPAGDGTLHIMKGMFAQIEVKPVRLERKAPRAANTIVLADYKITLSRPPARGFNRLRVENRGPEEHDVQVVRLRRGATVKQVLDWIESPGSYKDLPPGTPLGGMTGLNRGRTGYFRATLPPGSYVLLCFVPDKDGRPHFRHGMVRQFTIR